MSSKELEIEVNKWLSNEEFRRLLDIADYIGRRRGSSVFKINPHKIIRGSYTLSEVIDILESVGITVNSDLITSIKNTLRDLRKVEITWDGLDVVLKSNFKIMDLSNDLRKYLKYDRQKRVFKIIPMHYFNLINKLKLLDVTIIDKTQLSKSLNLPYSIELKISLRDYQEEALNKWLENQGKGIIAMPTGAGKTIVAIAALTKLLQKTLIVVYTKDQMMQWRDMILKYTTIDYGDVGLYYGEEKRIRPITITTYQTAFKHIKKLAPFHSFLIIDECLSGDTLVIMEDGGVKEIREIENGEKVLGGIVTNKFSKISGDLYYIKSSFADLIVTGTHPHIIVRRKRDKHRNQWFKVTESDIMIVPTYELKPGDCFLVPEKIPHVTKRNWTPEQLRLVALIACDGHIERDKPVIKVSVKKRDEIDWIKRIFIEGVKSFNIHDTIYEFTNNRGDYTIACYSPKLVHILTRVFGIPRGKKANIIDISNEIFYSPLESIKAFIEVCFSCEGWLARERNGSKRLYFASTSKKFVLKLQLLLKKFGIHSSFTIKRNKDDQRHDAYYLYIGGSDFNKAMEIFTFPKRSLNTNERNVGRYMNNKLKGFRLAKITEIKKLNERMIVYDFTSNGTHTFFANGIWTHNCHHLPADKFRYIAVNSFAHYRMGLSATVIREDGKHVELFPLMGGVVYYIQPEDLVKKGYLAPYTIKTLYVELTPKEKEELRKLIKEYKALSLGRKFDELLYHARMGDNKAQEALKIHSQIRQLIHKAKEKIHVVKKIVEEELKRGSKIIIFTQYVDQAKTLAKELNSLLLIGEMDSRERKRTLEAFKNSRSGVLVVTTVGDEGIDIPDANVGIIVTGTSSRRQFIQRLGRLLRPKEGRDVRLYEVVVKGTSEELSARKRKLLSLDEIL